MNKRVETRVKTGWLLVKASTGATATINSLSKKPEEIILNWIKANEQRSVLIEDVRFQGQSQGWLIFVVEGEKYRIKSVYQK